MLTTGIGETASDFLVKTFDPVPVVLIAAVLFGLLRGFRTAELVDSSTLPGLAADNHSGLRWA
ncbi:uncharacterized membrane protein (DUF106 family), partial [Salinibacterium sp. CAN_S4]